MVLNFKIFIQDVTKLVKLFRSLRLLMTEFSGDTLIFLGLALGLQDGPKIKDILLFSTKTKLANITNMSIFKVVVKYGTENLQSL